MVAAASGTLEVAVILLLAAEAVDNDADGDGDEEADDDANDEAGGGGAELIAAFLGIGDAHFVDGAAGCASLCFSGFVAVA